MLEMYSHEYEDKRTCLIEIVVAVRKEEFNSEFTVDRRTIIKIMENMAENDEILIVRRNIAISNVGRNQAEIEDEVENSNLREATFYVATDCDENTLGNFIRQYRTRLELDSLLKWRGGRNSKNGRMQGEFDIPKFQTGLKFHIKI